MREAAFIKQRQEEWEKFEEILLNSKPDPDALADMFIQLTDDLAFSQTQYPNSKTTIYLNGLASKVHQNVYKTKRVKKGRFSKFWLIELPLTVRACHPEMIYSFLIFLTAALIGALSVANDDTFVRLIMGDTYVNMTLQNISNDDPMAVYKQMGESEMFLRITLNNIRVSFMVFVMGVVAPVGTPYTLFQNGVMLGAFQSFFYQEGLFLTSFLTIWIHGTLEISAIVIAGGAGIAMGNGILFPGTFTRLESFKKRAKQGLKIIIGLVPIFIVAGFLEGFVTRQTDYPIFIKLLIIIASASFILYYFGIFPFIVERRAGNKKN